MHALAKFGLLTMLVTLAVLPNVLVTLSALPGANAQVQGPQPEALDWQTFLIPEFGTTVEYPAGIFSVPDGRAEKGIGQHFNSDDGRSLLTIYTRENEADDTPGELPEEQFARRARCSGLRAGHAILLRDLLDPARAHLLQPVQFLHRRRRGDPLPRPGLSASGKTRVGRRRDADQPIAAAARGLTVPLWLPPRSRLVYDPAARRRAREERYPPNRLTSLTTVSTARW